MNQIVQGIVDLLESKQANDVVVIDMEGKSYLMDAMIVCDASNTRLMDALLNYALEYLDQQGILYRPVFNDKDSDWLLIDALDVVVHIFTPSARARYQLEKLWKDVPTHE